MTEAPGLDVEVPVELLRRSAEALLARLEEVQGSVVALDVDYFWSIPGAEGFDPFESPQKLTLGQLGESMDNLRQMLENPDGPLVYGFVWLADVLRAVGHRSWG